MTSTASSVDKTSQRTRLIGSHNDWFVWGLYKTEMRRTWSMGLLYAIILFFAIPILNLLIYSGNADYYSHNSDRLREFLSSFFASSNVFLTVYAAIGGVIMAFIAMEYLFDRRKVNFVCSLPVKRHAYLLTKTAANMTWAVLAWIPAVVLMIAVTFLVPALRPYLGFIAIGCFKLIGTWFCLHLFFLGLSMLACAFCGTVVSGGAVMLLMLAGYVPIWTVSFLAFLEMNSSTISASYYYREDFFEMISGVFRLFRAIAQPKGVSFLLVNAVIGLVYLAISVLLTVFRQSEKAGVPFAYDRARDTVKYLVMLLASLLGGMLFTLLASGTGELIWGIFGVICASVLTWMLCNTLFYKTPKMMFVGRRGLCILTGIMILLTSTAPLYMKAFDRMVPSHRMTDTLVLGLGEHDLEIKDGNLIRMYNAACKNGYKILEDHDGIVYDGTGDEELLTLGIIWKTKLLLPIAKISAVRYDDWKTFVKALTAKSNFADIYFAEIMRSLEADRASGENDGISMWWESASLTDQYQRLSERIPYEKLESLLLTYREEMREKGADAMQDICIGTIRFRYDSIEDYSYRYREIPLFAGYEKTVAELNQICEDYMVDDSAINERVEYEVVKAKVYSDRDMQEIAVLTAEEFEAMLSEKSISRFMTGGNRSLEMLTLWDRDYYIEVSYSVTEYHTWYDKTETEDGEIKVTPNEEAYSTWDTIETYYFLDGCVPAEYR